MKQEHGQVLIEGGDNCPTKSAVEMKPEKKERNKCQDGLSEVGTVQNVQAVPTVGVFLGGYGARQMHANAMLIAQHSASEK